MTGVGLLFAWERKKSSETEINAGQDRYEPLSSTFQTRWQNIKAHVIRSCMY